ncbi:endonuclease/exonuclease/phosphatase family protein [Natronomonas salina]|uniref:endonuclease/exonuclease/phosphatase family protein n=1 Tax=Natronomonas salina TaxID=1710540 RepID=UPI0015B4503C|nr:endonuclease/exonuclease/phosphatase family protein [Natronomonas salina]QLD88187.1 endonuclease/exonuclease/phosphatase family protein [Natronomonas salina]
MTSTPTRRTVLGGVAGTAALGSVPIATADGQDLRVSTRNLYVGVDLFLLGLAEDLDDVREIAGQLLADARRHPYEARMEALAAEVGATEPAVLGLQEAAWIRTRSPSEFDGDHDPGATDVLVDLLSEFQAALSARGLEYEVAASTTTSDIEVPAATDDGDVDVRITDRTAILVRKDVTVESSAADRFEATVPIPLGETDLELGRGYSTAEISAGGETATVATTHLESFDGTTRQSQAEELLGHLPADRPVILTGDINSGPGGQTATYDLLRTEFADAVETDRSDAPSHTCCYGSDLRSDVGALSRRIDVVLYRGALEPTAVELVGVDPDERIPVERGGETIQIWPSDHAGVVASFQFGAQTGAGGGTSGPDSERTSPQTSAGPDGGDRQSESQSGFGFVATLVGAVLAAIGRRRGSD